MTDRMTDEVIANFEKARADGVLCHEDAEVLLDALKAAEAKAAEDLEAACKAVMQAGLATGHADTVEMLMDEVLFQVETLRARVVELEEERDDAVHCHKTSDEHRSAWQQRAVAAEAQLTALRKENQYLKEIYVDMGLHDSACRIDTDGECDCWHERFASELQSLLTQTAPTVNSVESKAE